MKELLILTDAGKMYGLGHISRCSALAAEFEKRGFAPRFVVNGDAAGFDNLNTSLCRWQENLEIADGKICVVDSYLLDNKQIAELSRRAKKILWFDDENLRGYNGGVVVNPSLFGAELAYGGSNTKYLLGERYVIVREAFREKFEKQIRKEIQEATIIMGGSDVLRLVPALGEALKRVTECSVNIITSPLASSYSQSMALSDGRLRVFESLQAGQVAEIFLRSDVVISAAGQTLYELIQLRTPAVLIAVAENQMGNIDAAVRLGLCERLSAHGDALADALRNILSILSFDRRTELCRNMSRYDFSGGAANIADEFLRS